MTSPPYITAVATYFAWTLLFLFGHIRDLFRHRVSKGKPGYAPIRQDYEDFYTRRMYYRIHDCFNRPIASAPDNHIDVLERTPPSGQNKLALTGRTRRCINLGSYNYLGFANADEYCTPRVLQTLMQYGCSTCCSRLEGGTTTVHVELERFMAEFIGKEAAMVYGMGFATNSTTIPALVGKGCLILSDALNHSSIVAGVRSSGAKVRVFRHNDPAHLEALLRTSIAEGQPRTHRPWKKILIIVEGIYSMEGEICRLKEIVELKKRYKAYLFLDEAHSIGALGKSGRGVCEHTNVDPADVDIMMGTFTKSFGSCGGYIAASKQLIQALKKRSPAHMYATSISPVAAQQILSAIKLILGEDGSNRGKDKIQRLHENSNYIRTRLLQSGMDVIGDYDSPVMPIMLYAPGKVSAVSRLAFERGLAVVVVGFPATSLHTSRVRVCISAAHTRQDLDYAIEVLKEVGQMCLLQYKPPLAKDIAAVHSPSALADEKPTAAAALSKTAQLVKA